MSVPYETHPSGGMLIRDMQSEDRPREKAAKYGIKSLTDSELMALIFSTGLKGKSVIQLSNEILADNDNHLSKIARLNLTDFLKRYKGIGPAKAITLLAALEIGSRAAADAASLSSPVVTSSATAVSLMRRHLNNLPYEEFWVMMLSQAGKVIKEVNVSRGGVSATAVDVRIIMKHAIDNYASAMILFHNHPSGTQRPSAQDDALTQKIVNAASLFDIRVNDHIIVTDGCYYSYHDNSHLL
ncbi:MAG: DNA repair protein RadC [Bacteroidales bacterium]|nr:DNA repair protein RadC [Bacteroidales bacterium]